MLLIITIAALVFLAMHWEYVVAMITGTILFIIGLFCLGALLTLTTLFFYAASHI